MHLLDILIPPARLNLFFWNIFISFLTIFYVLLSRIHYFIVSHIEIQDQDREKLFFISSHFNLWFWYSFSTSVFDSPSFYNVPTWLHYKIFWHKHLSTCCVREFLFLYSLQEEGTVQLLRVAIISMLWKPDNDDDNTAHLSFLARINWKSKKIRI